MTSSTTTATTTPTAIDAPVGDYVLSNGASSITFKTRHMFGLGAVNGRLSVGSGELHVAEDPTRSSVRAAIEAKSFTTRNPMRDIHVRSMLLRVKKHPTWTYESNAVVREGGELVVKGTFTVRGNSAPVSVVVDQVETAPNGQLTIRAHGEVDRYALGVTAFRGMAAQRLAFEIQLTAERS